MTTLQEFKHDHIQTHGPLGVANCPWCEKEKIYEEIRDYEISFNLYANAADRGRDMFIKAHGWEVIKRPDMGHLICWLMEQIGKNELGGVTRKLTNADVEKLMQEIASLKFQIDQLEREGSKLASWQCPYTDGKEGLCGDEYGNQYCAKDKKIKKATADLLDGMAGIETVMDNPLLGLTLDVYDGLIQ